LDCLDYLELLDLCLCDNLSVGNGALLYDRVRLHFVIHYFYLTCWCELNSIEPSGNLKLLIYSD